MSINWTTGAEFILTLLLVIVPWSFPSMGIAWRCVLWSAAWLLLLHFLFILIPFLGNFSTFVKIALGVGLSGFFAALVYSPIRTSWHAEQAAETTGTLIVSSTDATNELPRVQIGQGGTAFVLELREGQATNLFGMPFDVVNVKRVNNQLLLSTTVRDQAGNLVVEVVENRWTVSPVKTNCWDKNYTQDSLEVKDGRGRVVLQVRVLPHALQIEGEWPLPGGRHTLVAEDDQYTDLKGIVPRFKYPSEIYWGERVERRVTPSASARPVNAR
ncbi:MAG TPA: hypothetical protein VGQ72_07970 [Pyrinomonadaceae bacterium]|nr:hypothetical protein [Pyrinomonadaceae bacterium]